MVAEPGSTVLANAVDVRGCAHGQRVESSLTALVDDEREASPHECAAAVDVVGGPGPLVVPGMMPVRASGPESLRAFVIANTEVCAPPLLPELPLHLVTEVMPLWSATADYLTEAGLEPPYWAFAWAGGQTVARYILDTPSTVRGLRVLDFATGSGLVALAAAYAGAAEVVAIDCDPLAIAATTLNAERLGLQVDARQADVLAEDVSVAWLNSFDVVTAGDVCFDVAWAPRAIAWLRERAKAGALVLLGDPGRAYLPTEGLEELARHYIEAVADVDRSPTMTGVVHRLRADATDAAKSTDEDDSAVA